MAILNDATAVYLGSTQATRVMVGAEQVWPTVATPAPATPSFTQITVDTGVATHQFTTVANATLYRIETEKVD